MPGFAPLPSALVNRGINDACFIVRDHNGQALAFVYCEDEPGRRAAAKLLTRDEARRIGANIAMLPGPLTQQNRRDAKPAALPLVPPTMSCLTGLASGMVRSCRPRA
jgi:hypothetical protein